MRSLSCISNSFFKTIYLHYNYCIPGDRSSGLASEIDDADDENRSDIVISDNEDSNSVISQTMLSMMKKDFDSTPLREKASIPEIGIISAINDSSVFRDISSGNQTNDVELKNNNNSANRNLESMRNSLIDVEQRLKAQRYVHSITIR